MRRWIGFIIGLLLVPACANLAQEVGSSMVKVPDIKMPVADVNGLNVFDVYSLNKRCKVTAQNDFTVYVLVDEMPPMTSIWVQLIHAELANGRQGPIAIAMIDVPADTFLGAYIDKDLDGIAEERFETSEALRLVYPTICDILPRVGEHTL